MLPRKFRFALRQHPDFFSTAQRYFSIFFTLFYRPSDRFAVTFIVPKKAVSLATQRSRLKRKLSESLLRVIGEIKETLPDVQLVFSLKNKTQIASTKTLEQVLKKTLVEMFVHEKTA